MRTFIGFMIGMAIYAAFTYWLSDQMGVSDPVTPIEMATAETACAPHGGVVTLTVRRRGGVTDMTVQCKDGAVTRFAPKPATKALHRT